MDPKVLKDIVEDLFLTKERDSKGCITLKVVFVVLNNCLKHCI